MIIQVNELKSYKEVEDKSKKIYTFRKKSRYKP